MRRPSFNVMAKSPSILSAERSPAATVAIVVLCLLGLVQLGTLAMTAWEKLVPAPAKPAPVAAVDLPVSAGLPPLPSLNTGSLPPLPSLPGTAALSLPPLPAPAPTVAASLPSASLPPPSYSLPPPVSASLPTVAAALPTPAEPTKLTSPPRSKTGNPQVDELIEVAIESRALEDMEGAIQALERAELLLPNHPSVMREKALTLGRMGKQDQAQALWDRAKTLSSGGTAPAPPVNASAFPAPTTSSGPGGPLSLGDCQIVRDATVTTGQKLVVKVPVRSAPGATIDPSMMNLDVFFYDRVDGTRVENTKADPPVFSFDMPMDFATGEEVVSVVYHMPKLSAEEEAEIGRREFYGCVVKLYYQQKLLSTTAEPRDLLNQSGTSSGTALPTAQ